MLNIFKILPAVITAFQGSTMDNSYQTSQQHASLTQQQQGYMNCQTGQQQYSQQLTNSTIHGSHGNLSNVSLF